MLTGTWIPQGAEFAGQSVPMPDARLVIEGDRYVVEAAAGRDSGTLQIDTTVTPHAIDLVGKRGPNAGRTIPALFRIRGNLLQLCYCVGEENVQLPRPTEIHAAVGSMQILVRYRRLQAGL